MHGQCPARTSGAPLATRPAPPPAHSFMASAAPLASHAENGSHIVSARLQTVRHGRWRGGHIRNIPRIRLCDLVKRLHLSNEKYIFMRGFAGCSDGISAKTPEASDRIPDERPGMHLKKTKRNGRVYLSVVQNYREGNATKTRTIETIGYADAYESEFDDPIAHFEAYVAELNEQRRAKRGRIEFSFPRDCVIDADCTESARWGISIALAYLDALEAKRAHNAWRLRPAQTATKHTGSRAAARRAFEVFAAERVLHASPKHETWERRASFPRRCDFAIDEAYRALSVIAAADGRIARAMRAAYERIRSESCAACRARALYWERSLSTTSMTSTRRRNRNAERPTCRMPGHGARRRRHARRISPDRRKPRCGRRAQPGARRQRKPRRAVGSYWWQDDFRTPTPSCARLRRRETASSCTAPLKPPSRACATGSSTNGATPPADRETTASSRA